MSRRAAGPAGAGKVVMDVAERDGRYQAREEPPDGVRVARSDGCFLFDHLDV